MAKTTKTTRAAGRTGRAAQTPRKGAPAKARAGAKAGKTAAGKAANPLLARWRKGPFDAPPFGAIRAEHFAPAFRAGMKQHRAEVKAIAADSRKPSFANTIVALEKSGRLLSRVGSIFWNLVGSNADEALQALEREFAPKLAAHYTALSLDRKIFKRIADLWERRASLKLDAEQARVLERHYVELVRSGARLAVKNKTRVGEIAERLATLTSAFMQNVLKDEQSWRMTLDSEDDLAGLPQAMRDSAQRAAEDAGEPGKWAITLARSSVEGFLTFSSRRELRERAWRAWVSRGANGGESDNTGVLSEVVALRAEYARLMGFDTYADYNLDDAMAKTPAAVNELLGRVWSVALPRAREERDSLAEIARGEGDNEPIQAWDWRYYAEKARKARYDFDQSALRPYLSLEAMIAAAFDVAGKLFGLKFKELKDAPRYHADVRVFQVTKKNGDAVGLFLGDYFARPSKRSGAWMSSFRSQHRVDGDQRPIIVNVMNFARGGEGQPTLLSFDDARTLFHEFGHALHGLLSDVTYPSISGTAVARDFVELPSQLYEHWLSTPQVLRKFARHVETGEPMPEALLAKLEAARNFNQGFATVEFTSSALVDMALYSQAPDARIDTLAFEKAALEKIDMPAEIAMRHRLPHFMHIVGGYAAGYYSYMWSEVMDADAFAAFEETGDVFDRKTARRLYEFIYSAGNRRDPGEAWLKFRGRAPSVEGMLKKRGLAA
ncbi:MAG: M3 family metallopeptidase [Rhizobiales bacterium]|nr:M3 family metallopeptidase [Hyphomicrobiales bacterium]